MAIVDNNTPNRQYPEPDGNNVLADDVVRLQQALTKIDTDVANLLSTLSGLATLFSPAFTGSPSAPTPDASDQTSRIATTAFVAQALALINTNGLAPLDSPHFIGGPTVPTAAAGDASALIASTAFIANALTAIDGGSPAGLNTFVEIAAALNNDPAFAVTIMAILNDPWATMPLGVPIPIYDTLTPSQVPPINKSYRYIKLTAADAYNSGVLGSESVSGSAPVVTATATVTLANSPLLGQVVRLLNTEARFIRPGPTGTLEDSQNLSHGHGVNDPGHGHGAQGYNFVVLVGGSGGQGSTGGGYGTIGATSGAGTGISIQASGGNEARPRNMRMNHYMRIR
jgi:hypothetical protein